MLIVSRNLKDIPVISRRGKTGNSKGFSSFPEGRKREIQGIFSSFLEEENTRNPNFSHPFTKWDKWGIFGDSSEFLGVSVGFLG